MTASFICEKNQESGVRTQDPLRPCLVSILIPDFWLLNTQVAIKRCEWQQRTQKKEAGNGKNPFNEPGNRAIRE